MPDPTRRHRRRFTERFSIRGGEAAEFLKAMASSDLVSFGCTGISAEYGPAHTIQPLQAEVSAWAHTQEFRATDRQGAL